jgi:hypothetical protein
MLLLYPQTIMLGRWETELVKTELASSSFRLVLRAETHSEESAACLDEVSLLHWPLSVLIQPA